MNKARFYRKPENIDDLRPLEYYEARTILNKIPQLKRMSDKDMDFFLKIMTTDIEPSPYRIIARTHLSEIDYDEFIQNLWKEREIISKFKMQAVFDENGVAQCICLYCDNRDGAILVVAEGFSYARYCAKVPRAEVDS